MNAHLDLDTARPPEALRDAGGLAQSTRIVEGYPSLDGPQAITDSVSGTTTARRVNPDDGRFIRLVVGGVVIAGVVAFAISFSALYQVAEWLGIPPYMWWAVPVFIDLAILVYAGSVLVHKARGESTWASWAALGTFTALSVFANAAHAWSAPHDVAWQAVVGAVIAGMVPVAIFVATEQLSRVAVENPESRRAELRELARMDQARAEHQQAMDRMRFEQEQAQMKMDHEREMAQRAAELEREKHLTEVELVRAQREVQVKRTTTAPSEPSPRQTQEDPPPARQNGSQGERTAGLHVVAPQPSSSASAGSSDMGEVARFIAEHSAQGIEVTAAMLVERFGMSDRTWRRRLAALRRSQPEVFEGSESIGASDDEQERREA